MQCFKQLYLNKFNLKNIQNLETFKKIMKCPWCLVVGGGRVIGMGAEGRESTWPRPEKQGTTRGLGSWPPDPSCRSQAFLLSLCRVMLNFSYPYTRFSEIKIKNNFAGQEVTIYFFQNVNSFIVFFPDYERNTYCKEIKRVKKKYEIKN